MDPATAVVEIAKLLRERVVQCQCVLSAVPSLLPVPLPRFGSVRKLEKSGSRGSLSVLIILLCTHICVAMWLCGAWIGTYNIDTCLYGFK